MRRRHWIGPTFLSILLLLAVVWGYNQHKLKTNYEITLENHYQRLFQDVKKHVENVQVSLSKALLATSKEHNILLFSQIMSDAQFAQDKLGQMPISHSEASNTQKFLSQAADYSYYLIQKHLDGEDITPEQRQNLTNIQKNSADFNGELENLNQAMMESNFVLGATSARGMQKFQEANTEALRTSLGGLDKQVSETPELIYDGPFADQMINRKPVGLPQNNVDLQEAGKIARQFFGEDRVAGLEAFEEGENIDETRIPSHTFHVYPSNQQKDLAVYMGVSKKGGKVLWMANPRNITQHKLSIEEAEKKAREYLDEKGFTNMEPNYSLHYDGTVLFNFAYTENDITIYPDLIKVKIALDTGETVGFDASAYYLNHHKRDFATPEIDETTAKEKIKTDFNIDSVRLTLIPKGKNEILCYEFKGKYMDGDYIVYINSKTGREEQILRVIHNENGTLTF